MKEGSNRLRVMLLGLLLLLLAAGFLVGRQLPSHPWTPKVEDEIAEVASDPVPGPGNDRGSRGPDSSPPSVSTPLLEDPRPGDASTVRLADMDDKPVAGVLIQVRAIGEDDWREFASDAKGVVALPYQAGVPCEFQLPGDAWRFVIASFRGIYADRIERVAGSDVPIRIALNNQWNLEVKYADGLPYVGRFLVRGSNSPAKVLVTDESGRADYSPSLNSEHVEIRVESRRTGFGPVTLKEKAGTGPQTLTITLPESDNNGGLIMIDLIEFAGAGPLHVVISPENDPLRKRQGSQERDIEPARDYTSRVLLEGEYRVSVRAEALSPATVLANNQTPTGLAWSHVVTVLRGQTAYIRARPVHTSAARARILDANGDPVPMALLSVPREAMVRWSSVESAEPGTRRPGAYAIADEDGVATIVGLLSDITELQAVAKGYQVHRVPVLLRPGETSDLGDITLAPATGTISITIEREGEIADESYEIRVLETGGGSVLPKQQFQGRWHMIEGLPYGRYTIAIRALDGAVNTGAQNVVLTATEPNGELVFVVSQRE